MQHGKVLRTGQYEGQLLRQRAQEIKVTHSYKPRVKSEEQTAEERIAQLEMEVDLLRNFLLETERRQIAGSYIPSSIVMSESMPSVECALFQRIPKRIL